MAHPLQHLFDASEKRAAESCPKCSAVNGSDWPKCVVCGLERTGWRSEKPSYLYRLSGCVTVGVDGEKTIVTVTPPTDYESGCDCDGDEYSLTIPGRRFDIT